MIELFGEQLSQDSLRTLVRHRRDLAEIRPQDLAFGSSGQGERRADSRDPGEPGEDARRETRRALRKLHASRGEQLGPCVGMALLSCGKGLQAQSQSGV